ncbi:unnamed protein product [Vicia faba]|uniref:Uncharacterized protein n=1 Tax=Vicia faba TaxID=3906 RepID=A0AAV0ZEF0_VICFA|nr:unnamed protein product [Vicia faba]
MITYESSNNMQLQLQDGTASSVNVMRNLTHVMASSIAGLIGDNSVMVNQQKIVPYLHQTESGRVAKLEIFSHYVARQMGFVDVGKVPELCRLAQDYLRNTEGCKENIYQYLANGDNANALYAKLIEEFERCILSYFSFHWNRASFIITHVLSSQSQPKINLKNILLEATREHRFKRITKKLRVRGVQCCCLWVEAWDLEKALFLKTFLDNHFGQKLHPMLWLLKQMLLRRVMSFIELLTLRATMMKCFKVLNWCIRLRLMLHHLY